MKFYYKALVLLLWTNLNEDLVFKNISVFDATFCPFTLSGLALSGIEPRTEGILFYWYFILLFVQSCWTGRTLFCDHVSRSWKKNLFMRQISFFTEFNRFEGILATEKKKKKTMECLGKSLIITSKGWAQWPPHIPFSSINNPIESQKSIEGEGDRWESSP